MSRHQSGRAVGIDLGTTYTAVAYVDDYGKPVVLKNSEGQITTPSVVFVEAPHYVVGEVALQATLTDPDRVVQFIKRFMGVKGYRARVAEREFSPEFVSSLILRKVVQEAAATLGETISAAVITVPAYFTEAQRQATYDAAVLAGIEVLRLINEPTAAALSYGLTQQLASAPAISNPALEPREITYRGRKIAVSNGAARGGGLREIHYRGRKIAVGGGDGTSSPSSNSPANALPEQGRRVLVYDLGGGTFDLTVLSITPHSLDVLAVGGEPFLGGKDWDDVLLNFLEERFEKTYGAPLHPDAALEAELRLKVEAAKRQLSGRPSVPITFKTRMVVNQKSGEGERDLESVVPIRLDIARSEFELLTSHLLERTQGCLENVLEQAHLAWSDIDEILCVGGSSRMPMVSKMLTRLSGRAPLLHDPDECVAKGAALQAALILNDSHVRATHISHVLPHSLGVAAKRANGNGESTLRIEHVIPALTPLPCARVRNEFTTTLDDQIAVEVHIYEGESGDPDAYPEGPIGTFHLDVSPPRPKGQPKIRVEFRCDENGGVVALARDEDTGRESRAFISLGSSRSNAEMQRESQWLAEAIVA